MAETSSPPSEEVVIANDVGDWYIVDWEIPTDNLRLSVAMNSLDTPHERDTGVNYPLPRTGTSVVYPIVETSTAKKATRFPLTVDFLGDEDFEKLERHRLKKRAVLLQSPYGTQWWFVFGPSYDESVRNTNDPIWRFVDFEVVEVVPVTGTGVFTESTYAELYEETY